MRQDSLFAPVDSLRVDRQRRAAPGVLGAVRAAVRAAVRSGLVGLLAAVVAACGGGGGSEGDSGGLSIGRSQTPDPVVIDFPIAYVRRPLAIDEDGAAVVDDVREPLLFRPGAQLVLRERASPSAPEKVLTDRAFPAGARYDVRDVEPSYDGKQLIFSMRAPPAPNGQPQPTWDVWIYDLPSDSLRKVMASAATDDAGDDIDPHFLPDGRIVFASNRQRRTRAVLLDEGKPQYSGLRDDGAEPALVLHVMDADGSDILQLSFNLSDDLDPTVDNDGRIVFSRWDNAGGTDRISLFRVRPDGSELERLYGFASRATGSDGAIIEFVEARPLGTGDDRLLVRLAPAVARSDAGSDLVAIDVENFVDVDRALAGGNATANAQKSVFVATIRSDAQVSAAGRYRSGFPLGDGTGRLLVTYSPCRLRESTAATARILPCGTDPAARNLPEAPPLYGVWVYDPRQDTQQPVVAGSEGVVIEEAVVLAARSLPPVLLAPVPGVDVDETLVDENAGILDIRSVYDVDGVDVARPSLTVLRDPSLTPAATRPAYFLRLIRPVLLPDDDVIDIDGTAFGRSAAQGMREIIGYAPIEPDGSVRVKIPADVAFTLAVVDRDGQQISARHDYWLQVSAGETLTCHGCHAPNAASGHGRAAAEAPSINPGAPGNGPFPNANPAISGDAGDSMARARERTNRELAEPSFDQVFTDVWSDPARQAPAAAFARRFAALQTPAPITSACADDWSSRCRATIHYPVHLQPLFDLPRTRFAADGTTVLEERRCTSCHGTVDAMNAARVPAAQLDLSATASPDEGDHTIGYRELLFPDVEVELVGNVLRDRLVPQLDGNGNPVPQLDANGNPLLDENGAIVPVLVTVPVAESMSVGGALASARFFAPFAVGGSHAGYLSEVELKLLREWLDLGAQYYNDPFAVPQ